MSHPACIKRLLEEFQGRSRMRATSLIVTVFGDVVSVHGGEVWLGSLVNALAKMGVAERLVRTSVFRLVKDGWLESEKLGRKSYYRFSDYGRNEYGRAAHRIYDLSPHGWDGNWQLVIPLDLPEETREPFRRSLHWQGFRTITGGVLARPEEDRQELLETIEEFGVAENVLLFYGTADEVLPEEARSKLVHRSWKLDEGAAHYRDFIQHYKPLHNWLARHEPSPEAAFIARTLLVHDYRRILLKDTALPAALLPQDWPGATAQAMVGEIYLNLAEPSTGYIRNTFVSSQGTLSAADRAFNRRFRSA